MNWSKRLTTAAAITLVMAVCPFFYERFAPELFGLARAGTRAQQEPPPPTKSPDPPPDVDIPEGFPGIPFKFFDDYSWRIFIALNWPAKAGERGVPDRDKPFGDVSGPVVWETWKAAQEVFLPDGADPTPWDSHESPGLAVALGPALAAANQRGDKILYSFSELEDINQANFSPDEPLGPLVAQDRNYVRYETRFNRVEFEKIRGNPAVENSKLYLRKNLPKKGETPLVFPHTSIEIKAAWREFDLSNPIEKAALGRYYHVQATVMDPETFEPDPDPKTVGLVGFHIVQKTHSRPQWIWSTFEHVDNLEGLHPRSFNNPDGPQDPQSKDVNVDPDTGESPKPLTKANPAPKKEDRKPIQVVRTRPIPPETKEMNHRYQELVKGTVWENYQLVMTQWPSNPGDGSGLGDPFPGSPTEDLPPTNVSNATMETYLQDFTTCMHCHGFSVPRRTDFVFTLSNRAYEPPPPAAGMTHTQAEQTAHAKRAEEALRDLTERVREKRRSRPGAKPK